MIYVSTYCFLMHIKKKDDAHEMTYLNNVDCQNNFA